MQKTQYFFSPQPQQTNRKKRVQICTRKHNFEVQTNVYSFEYKSVLEINTVILRYVWGAWVWVGDFMGETTNFILCVKPRNPKENLRFSKFSQTGLRVGALATNKMFSLFFRDFLLHI